MQTTQKRQEDDVKVRAGPLHFDANPASAFPGNPGILGHAPSPSFGYAAAQGYAVPNPFLGAPSFAWPQTAWPQHWTQHAWPQGAVPQAFPQPVPSSFAQAAREGMASAGYPHPLPHAPGNAQRVPACDIVDEGSEYVCQVELPGIKRENVDVSCFERALLVTAHAEPDIDVGALVLSERGSSTSFRRAITLPNDIQTADAKATLRDGILTINLPKTRPTAGPKRIPVA